MTFGVVAGAVLDGAGTPIEVLCLAAGAASCGGTPLSDVLDVQAAIERPVTRTEIAKIRFTGLAYATNVTATTLGSYAREVRWAHVRGH